MRVNALVSKLSLTGLLLGWLAVMPAQASLFGLSEQDEIAAGRQVAAQAQKEYGPALPASDPRARRVTNLGMMFAHLSTRKNIPYSYQVLQNDTVLNAFSGPGGPVFITTKLLSTTTNDAELAYVLGHETGHIEHRHIAKAIEKQQEVGLFAGVLGSILTGGKGNSTLDAATNIAFTVWSRGYSRDQETEADESGTIWMSQLGFDPHAAITMLGRLGDSKSTGLEKYLATHPDPATRQAHLQQLITTQNLEATARQHGGPKLWLTGSATSNYVPATAPLTSPGVNPVIPPAPPVTTTSNGEIQLNAPIILVDRGAYRVVQAPIGPLVRWAGQGDSLSVQGTQIIVDTGQHKLLLQRDSDLANLDGREIRLSAPTQVSSGYLYCSIGILAQALGGEAAYVAANHTVQLTLPSRSGFFSLNL